MAQRTYRQAGAAGCASLLDRKGSQYSPDTVTRSCAAYDFKGSHRKSKLRYGWVRVYLRAHRNGRAAGFSEPRARDELARESAIRRRVG